MHWTCRNTTRYELGFIRKTAEEIAAATSVPAQQPTSAATPERTDIITSKELELALVEGNKRFPGSMPFIQWLCLEISGRNK